MNFELTEERQMLQDTLRRFLRDRYDTATRNEILNSASGLSADLWAQLADLGVIGALFDEASGGFGGQGFDIAVVFEELGRAGVVEPFLDSAVLCGGLVAALGDSAQRELVDQVIGGQVHLALAHAEPTARYDLSRVAVMAQTNGTTITLSGRKAVVVNAEAASHLIVSARESGAVDDQQGISLFLVPCDTAGVSMRGYPLVSGGRAADVTLDGVTLNAEHRLGAAGAAYPALAGRVAAAEVALAAETLGAMETATELTRDYLTTRKQFGRPLATFQALAFRFADMLTEIEQARSAVINAAGHLGADPRIRDMQIAAARNLIGRTGRLIAEDSIQMHGGIAMTQEYELAHIAKRITMADHRFGDTDTQLERFIALSTQ
jgi:alkylation response protein AidB-like acyl-CoA dehydrogenase